MGRGGILVVLCGWYERKLIARAAPAVVFDGGEGSRDGGNWHWNPRGNRLSFLLHITNLCLVKYLRAFIVGIFVTVYFRLNKLI